MSSPVEQNPYVEVGGNYPLRLAINTAQFGRTFQVNCLALTFPYIWAFKGDLVDVHSVIASQPDRVSEYVKVGGTIHSDS